MKNPSPCTLLLSNFYCHLAKLELHIIFLSIINSLIISYIVGNKTKYLKFYHYLAVFRIVCDSNARSSLHYQSKREAKPNGSCTYVSIEKLLSNAFARQVKDVHETFYILGF